MAAHARAGGPNPKTGKTGRPIHLGHLALVYLAFAVLCLITSVFFTASSGRQTYTAGDGNTFGPIEVADDRSVYEIKVRSTSLPNNSWAFVEVQLLDARGEYLFSMGDELSFYSGRDSDGPWTERKDSYVGKMTIPEAGSYYIRVLVQRSAASAGALYVSVSRLYGSSLPYLVAAIAALVIAVVLNELQNRTITRFAEMVSDMSDEDH